MSAARRERLFLLDGLALAYRSHFAFIRRPLTNSRGENTSAVFAFANTVIKLRDQEKPEHWALAWDSPTPTRRHTKYPDYKAHRPPMPDDLVSQLPRILALAEAIGLPKIEVDGTEADDVMATLAKRAVAQGMDVVLVTNDKDLQQLVSPHVKVLAPGGGAREDAWLDEAAVQAKWGVPPAGLRDVLALMGDSSDNVPGVPGVGEKTAVELIAQFGSLDQVYARLSEVKKDSVRKKLAENRDAAYLSQELVTVDDDLDIADDWDTMVVRPIDGARLRALAAELDINRLARYADQADAGGDVKVLAPSSRDRSAAPPAAAPVAAPAAAPAPPAAPPASVAAGSGDERQLGFGFDLPPDAPAAPRPAAAAPVAWEEGTLPPAYGPAVRILTTAKELAALAKQLRALPHGFVVDTETTAEDPLRARLVGVGFAWGEAPVYVPLAHKEGVNAPREAFDKAIAPLLADPAVAKIGQNFKYDQLVFRTEGYAVAGLGGDTMIASYLLDPETPHNLDWLSANHLGVSKIPTSALIGKRGKEQRTMDQVPVAIVAAYCGEDVHCTWELAQRFLPQMEIQGFLPLYHDVELPLSEVLAAMEWEGVALDVPFLATMSKKLGGEIEALEKRVHEAAGQSFNVQSPPQLAEILFEKLGLPGGKKTKTGFSTDSDVLEELAEPARAAAARARVPPAGQAQVDLRRHAAGARPAARRPPAHQLQPDGRGDRAAVVERSQPAEHPDPHAAGPRGPPRLRRPARAGSCCRPTTRRSSCA